MSWGKGEGLGAGEGEGEGAEGAEGAERCAVLTPGPGALLWSFSVAPTVMQFLQVAGAPMEGVRWGLPELPAAKRMTRSSISYAA